MDFALAAGIGERKILPIKIIAFPATPNIGIEYVNVLESV
jgi:hypothetical protein